MKKSQDIFDQMFSKPRDKRSPEYKAGALMALQFKLKESSSLDIPYKIGTAQADAFLSGMDEAKSYSVN